MDLRQGSIETIKRYLGLDPSLYEETVDDEVQWRGRIFSADVLKVKLPDGSYGTREIAWHHGGCGVAAFREGKLCLVRQYRVALGCMTLEIPAGKLEMGEEPIVCAARELTEETGLVADELVPLAVSAGSIGFTNEATRVFLACGLHQSEAHPDEGEFVDVVWLPLEDILAGVRVGLIQDSKTIIAAQALALGER